MTTNNVTLIGRLTKDADLRYTSNGTATANITLAVDRGFKNQEGKKETDFINCVVWRKPAETLANFTKKGSMISVRGRIQTRNYDNKEGTKIYVTEVVVEEFTFLDSKKDSGTSYSKPEPKNDDSFASSGTEINIDDMGNLPF